MRNVNGWPKRLAHGDYVATLEGMDDRAEAVLWRIKKKGTDVGSLWVGDAYGWDRTCFSISKLVWSGEIPPGCSDPKSDQYGMCFDGVGFKSHDEALREFARRADRLIKWREGRGK